MKLLVHICCAICWAKTLAGAREEFGSDLEVMGLWYNPNIHPLLEYRKRMKAVSVYSERDPVTLHVIDEYGIAPFCATIHPNYEGPNRCRACYRMRLDKAARYCHDIGYTHFTTTMITSTHQDHDLIRELGEAAAHANGVKFLYRDYRAVEVEEKTLKGIYHQQYCGCVFSENERFRNTTKELYKGGKRDGES
ncbi:MAG: epoxyqueuosine reductase QueH [Planctomycetes bacterium]|nr:epoxyqueuosine reductase QueH [Planctomycetota bacterium]